MFQCFAESPVSHLVTDGECLSQIAYKYCRKIYGKNGFINHIKKLNPQLYRKPNLLIPNTALSIPSLQYCKLKWPEAEYEKDPIVESEKSKPQEYLNLKRESHREYFAEAFQGYKLLGSSSIVDANSNSFKRIKGVSLVSKPILGFNIGRRFEYSSQTHHIIFGGIKFEDYYGSKKVTVNSSSIFRSNLGFGFEHMINQQHFFIVTAGAEERTIIDESVYNQINLTKILVPNLGLKHSYLLRENVKQKSQLLSFGRYLSDSGALGLKVKKGYELGLGLNYKILGTKFPSEWLINLARLEQSTNVSYQTEWCFGVNWSVDFSISDN
jgi:hypothetical protein